MILSITLLFAAVLLIWNTIRTAMFARRREIEVMKLVGATDWFIRIPFMLEGLIQGFIGGVAACGGLWLINNRWTAGVKDFPANSGFAALVVTDGYVLTCMLDHPRPSACSPAPSAPASPRHASWTSDLSVVIAAAAGTGVVVAAAVTRTRVVVSVIARRHDPGLSCRRRRHGRRSSSR